MVSVAVRKGTLAIVSNVLLDARDGRLALSATDLDMQASDACDAEVAEPGAITVDASQLYEFAGALPAGGQIEMRLDGRLEVRCGRARAQFPALPAVDFPSIEELSTGVAISLPAGALDRLLHKVQHAISGEKTRPQINGVRLELRHDGATSTLRAVATDGHQLGQVDYVLSDDVETMPAVTVPLKTVAEFRRLLADATAAVDLRVTDKRIQLTVGSARITSVVLGYDFPDYERVIPRTQSGEATLGKADLELALKRLGAMFEDRARPVRLRLQEGLAGLLAKGANTGVAEDELEATYSGPEIEIGFNARYLHSTLDRIDGRDFSIGFTDATAPVSFRDPADPLALFIIMPLRV